MKSFSKLLFCLIEVLITIPLIRCELFTALVHLEKLLNTEKVIVGSLEEYLSSEEQRLSQLRQRQRQLTKHYSDLNAIASKDSYLSNPINAYLLVKRLTTDWESVGKLLGSENKHKIDRLQQNLTFPSNHDLVGI